MNPRCPKTSPSPPAPGVFISLITTSKFEKCSQFCSYNSYFLSNKMLISRSHISPSSHREFFIANINICFLAPIRNKPVKIIHNYLCSRTTKVSPPSTGGDYGEGVHKRISIALLSPSPQPSPIKREREDVLSYCTIIKNPYDPYLDNNPAFQFGIVKN